MTRPVSIRNAQNAFLDREAVIGKVGKAKARVLTRAGYLVRKIAQRLMRYRKKASKPGQPPSAHKDGKGPLLRQFILFGWDDQSHSVFVGPTLLAGHRREATILEEFGGAVRRKGFKARKGRTKKQLRYTKSTSSTAIYPPRPTMKPALVQAVPKLAQLWRDSVKP